MELRFHCRIKFTDLFFARFDRHANSSSLHRLKYIFDRSYLTSFTKFLWTLSCIRIEVRFDWSDNWVFCAWGRKWFVSIKHIWLDELVTFFGCLLPFGEAIMRFLEVCRVWKVTLCIPYVRSTWLFVGHEVDADAGGVFAHHFLLFNFFLQYFVGSQALASVPLFGLLYWKRVRFFFFFQFRVRWPRPRSAEKITKKKKCVRAIIDFRFLFLRLPDSRKIFLLLVLLSAESLIDVRTFSAHHVHYDEMKRK